MTPRPKLKMPTIPGLSARPADPAAKLGKALLAAARGDTAREDLAVAALVELKRTVNALGTENLELRGAYRKVIAYYKAWMGQDYVG